MHHPLHHTTRNGNLAAAFVMPVIFGSAGEVRRG